MNLSVIFRKTRQRMYVTAFRLFYVRRIETNILNKWLKLHNTERIADIACGKGMLSLLLAPNSQYVCGLDLDRNNIVFANSINTFGNCEFQVGDAEALPYQCESFDLVICNCSLEHFDSDEKALLEIRKVLRTGGKLFLTVDSFSGEGVDENIKAFHKTKYRVVNYYSLPELCKKLEKIGFSPENSIYYINSQLSKFVHNLLMRIHPEWMEDVISLLLFPVIWPLIVISDRFSSAHGGYGLAVLAERKRAQNLLRR